MKYLILIVISTLISGSMFLSKKDDIPPYKNPKLSLDERVEDLLKRMTLDEKIDMLGGTGFATKPNARLGIPELRMTDGPLGARWGKSTAFPSGICLSSTWDPALANNVGAAIGREVKGHDRHVILGPCVNIARIPQGGRNFESYGEDPYLASRMAVDYIKGVQSEGVAATVKHFACNNQEDQRMFVDTKVDERTLNEIYLPAFKAAVQEADVLCLMNAYNKVNGNYCSENDHLLIDKLKKEWGYKWLVMSDWGAVHSSIPTVNGGMDLEMPKGEFLNKNTLMDAIKSGTVKESTIDDKVKRILSVIFKLGLFEKPSLKDESLIGSRENLNVAFEAARSGIVLLQNTENILPLDFSKLKSIAVIGPNASIARTGGGGSSQVDVIKALSPLDVIKEKFGGKLKINFAAGVHIDGESDAIPSKNLFTDKNEQGLLGEYFDNMELKGTPSFSRIDKQVNFDFGEDGPTAGFNKFNYSVRWTGKIKAEKTGSYSLELTSDDGVRLWLDDKMLIDYWNDHAPEAKNVNVSLETGKEHKIKIEFYQNKGGAVAKLGWYMPEDDPMKSALDAAKNSEAVILFVGTSPRIESEGADRENIVLPADQDKLIEEVAKVNKNVVVVINSGSPVLMEKWIGKVKGLVQAWFGGSEMSRAALDILSGVYNPSGKLPMSFPKKWEDCSAYKYYKAKDSVTEYTDGIYVGYRHFDKNNIEPLFPFGFGFSYTTFAYSNLKITKLQDSKDLVKVTFEIKNTGKVAGAEVAQLYVRDIESKLDRPVKELKGFKKVFLKPGESKTAELTLDASSFSYYEPSLKYWLLESGEFEILIGASSRDIKLKGNCSL
ncbi:MAG: glycoside hydrolase family 3 C-terminal domain-containing protein [Ignavibacteriales bacterium]|nr:glycoside hydrolase family 3 C-terminal domain-containing protein [Ignavibacteriales bacterium]